MFYLIIPNIRSCHNVGAMFRTADACGVEKIFLVGFTPFPPRPQIDKVSLGAEKWMLWEHKQYLKPLIKRLKKKGFQIIGLEKTKNSTDLSKISYQSPVVLIVGNEVDGIRPDILKLCDQIVHIPMYGMKESLNVSVAAGIGMFEIKKQLEQFAK